MKKLYWLVAVLLLAGLLSCETLQRVHEVDCHSQKTVPVVYVTRSGEFRTINVPYCDTILLKADRIDSVDINKRN